MPYFSRKRIFPFPFSAVKVQMVQNSHFEFYGKDHSVKNLQRKKLLKKFKKYKGNFEILHKSFLFYLKFWLFFDNQFHKWQFLKLLFHKKEFLKNI